MAQDMATIETRDVDALAGGDKKEFVTFFIDNQMFGIPVLNVQDILMTTNIAAIPQAPPAVRGSINLRRPYRHGDRREGAPGAWETGRERGWPQERTRGRPVRRPR